MYHQQQQQIPQQMYQQQIPQMQGGMPQTHGGPQGGGMQHPIRNRIYVGGIPQTASQDELRDYFAYFGSIKDARIITDTVGNSKGYGFVTYENESDAMKVLAQREQDFIFKESKLNIGQAFRQNNQNGPNNFNRQNGGGAGGFGGPQNQFGGQQMNGGGGFGGGFQPRRNPRFN